MSGVQKRIAVTTRTEYAVTISGVEILDMLRERGMKIPPMAQVTFDVPSGGDYSGMTIDINVDNPVTVSWKTTEESKS